MTDSLTSQDVESAVRALVEACPTPLGLEVSTPVIYANGDYVTVIVAQESDGYITHDAGMGGMHIASEGIGLGGDMATRLRGVAARYDCQIDGGRITRSCALDDLGASVALVANASRAVGDVIVEIRRHGESQFRHVVTEGIREIAGDRLRENESFKGASGTTYRVPNVILDQNLQVARAFVLPVASRSAVPTQFRELFDLRAAFPDVYLESIYNDESDFRPQQDGWVLQQVGEVLPISALRARMPKILGRV
jgi:hypothetical protein